MRPFRFFFGVSLAVILFFFFARLVLWALIAAAVMSVVFHVSRKVKNFFRNLRWEDDDYYHQDKLRNQYEMSPRFSKRNEEFFNDFPKRNADFLTDYRSISVQ